MCEVEISNIKIGIGEENETATIACMLSDCSSYLNMIKIGGRWDIAGMFHRPKSLECPYCGESGWGMCIYLKENKKLLNGLYHRMITDPSIRMRAIFLGMDEKNCMVI